MIARVAIVCPYALDVFGGVQEQAFGMSRELATRNIEVLLLSPEGGPLLSETPAQVERVGRRLSLPANGSKAPITLSLSAARKSARLIDDFNPDVVHIHEPFAPVLAYHEVTRRRRPHVATFHRSGGGPAYSLTRPLLTWLLRGIDARVAVSDAASATLRHATGANSDVLFNGFEMNRFASKDRPTRPRVLFLGRLEDRKGLAVLLEAHRTASFEYDLVIAGGGPGLEAAKAQASTSVQVLGPVDDLTKRELLATSSALVAPSLYGESFGLILLEAMASRTPVVASDIEGYAIAAAGHAELFSPGDASDLNRALRSALLATTESREAAYRHAESYSMSRLMDRYLEIYERSLVAFSRR